MNPGQIGRNSIPRQRLAQLRHGISHNTHMNIRLGTKAPTHIFSMGSDETIYYRNVSIKLTEAQIECSPFAIVLNNRVNFKKLAAVLSCIPLAYVYDPHGNHFAFSPWDFNMSHEDLSRSLLINALSFHHKRADTVFEGTIKQSMLLKGAYAFDTQCHPRQFSTIIMTSKEDKNPESEKIMVMQTYLRLALILRAFGCSEHMSITDYVPREGMNRFQDYLKSRNIKTIGEIIFAFEKSV